MCVHAVGLVHAQALAGTISSGVHKAAEGALGGSVSTAGNGLGAGSASYSRSQSFWGMGTSLSRAQSNVRLPPARSRTRQAAPPALCSLFEAWFRWEAGV